MRPRPRCRPAPRPAGGCCCCWASATVRRPVTHSRTAHALAHLTHSHNLVGAGAWASILLFSAASDGDAAKLKTLLDKDKYDVDWRGERSTSVVRPTAAATMTPTAPSMRPGMCASSSALPSPLPLLRSSTLGDSAAEPSDEASMMGRHEQPVRVRP